jgi:hypothetical protein
MLGKAFTVGRENIQQRNTQTLPEHPIHSHLVFGLGFSDCEPQEALCLQKDV